MAKQGGLGDNFYIGGNDLSGDISALTRIGGGPAALDSTAISQSAAARFGGERDGSMEGTSLFDPAVGASHPVLSALPTADVICSYFRGKAIGNPAASLVGKQINYDGSRGQDGSFTFGFQVLANGFGLEWGVQLTAGMRTDAGPGVTGASFDTGGALSFGGQAYLHVSAFTGTDVTIKIQDSSDNISFADVAGFGFAQVTGGAPLAQRIALSNVATIRQYVLVKTITGSGFTSCTFAVSMVKNPVAGVVF